MSDKNPEMDIYHKMKQFEQNSSLTATQISDVLELMSIQEEKFLTKKEFYEYAKSVDKRFEQVDKRFEQVDKRFEQVDKRFEQVDKRFEQVDKRFEQVDKRFDEVDKRFDEVNLNIKKIVILLEHQQNSMFKQGVIGVATALGIIFTAIASIAAAPSAVTVIKSLFN